MQRQLLRRGAPTRAFPILLAALTVVAFVAAPASAGTGPAALDKIETVAYRQAAAPGGTTVLVNLAEVADTKAATATATTKLERSRQVFQTLTAHADRTQAGLRALLSQRGADFTPYWIANTIVVRGADQALLAAISSRSEVASITANHVYPLLKPVEENADDPGIQATEWGVNFIQAPQVWSEFNRRGEGIVVANIDTGVDFDHPALVRQYRGNNGGSFDHNYNWHDPTGVCGNTPCDNNNHGTHTAGTMVGEDASLTNQVGVAPRARWIAAKGCGTNSCASNTLLSSGQWVAAPTNLAGGAPRPDLAPDVVNNSWGGGRGDPWYQQTVNNWIAAGIFPSFSQGNAGPGCSTANSPGDYANAYGVGAFDINGTIASFSSRGPGGFGGIKPNISAPGANVRSSVNGGGYANFSGTSMAAPHLSGAVALIWSVAPSIQGNINATRTVLDETATDVNTTTCGGTTANNNVHGQGRLNALAAARRAAGGGGNPPVTVFSDNFETNQNWVTNPNGTDTATTGQWQRGDPQQTTNGGTVMQVGTTPSGVNDLVTAAAAGASVGANDIDGGTTSIRSPVIAIPAGGTITLSFAWYLAHLNNATNADFIRVRVISGATNTIVFQQLGAASTRAGSFATASVNISSFAGQSVTILIEAADAATASLVEAGVDDVLITRQT